MTLPFMPRGPGALVSILLPTRGRPKCLVEAVRSAWDLAENKEDLEFILKVDGDDPETLETLDGLSELLPGIRLSALVSPRGQGYADLHHWVNEMARCSTGDWIFIFNDDARFVRQDWDHLLRMMGTGEGPWLGMDQIALVVVPTLGRPLVQEFVFLRRQTFDLLGHFSLSPHCDNWIYTVMAFMRAVMFTPFGMEHHSESMDDATRTESVEAYKTTSAAFSSLSTRKLLLEDVSKVADRLTEISEQAQWTNKPAWPGWYLWRKDADSPCKTCLVRDGKMLRYVPDDGGKFALTEEGEVALVNRGCEVMA